ncbi:hypothetical protein L9F63_015276, partial [Diploptera punctata]
MADSEDTAVLEVSAECKQSVLKAQDSKDTDIMSNCSTSLEGSVVKFFSPLPDPAMSEFGQPASLSDPLVPTIALSASILFCGLSFLVLGDLQVKVDNPQKHLDTLETYITFRITTK